MGVNKPLSRDCLGKDNYHKYNVSNQEIQYPTCNNLYTEQSRATNPAWWYRDLEQVDWYYPPLNPQENTCFPFQNNLSTRILEKDCFQTKRPCLPSENNNNHILPVNSLKNNSFSICTNQNSCEKVNSK
jgi:hypothetical protein